MVYLRSSLKLVCSLTLSEGFLNDRAAVTIPRHHLFSTLTYKHFAQGTAISLGELRSEAALECPHVSPSLYCSHPPTLSLPSPTCLNSIMPI